MLIILSSIVFIILFLQTFFLGGTVWLGIIGMLLCAAGIVLSILLKQKEKQRLAAISVSAGLILSVLCSVWITAGGGAGTLEQKSALLKEIASAETVQVAEEKYDTYIEVYGEDDTAVLCLVKYYIKADEADKSESPLWKLKDETSTEYYLTKVDWYNKFSNDRYYVIDTLLDAVAEHPTWAKGHLMLGLSYYEREDNTSAIYYLKKAQLLDPSDGYSLCYLGVISYDRGSYKAAAEYLNSAEKLAGNDNYLRKIIDTYRECVAREAK
ncbi:pilus assembly protein TadD [Hydrogeniiclostridium mannosilyticum]|uniref:Pilus assembly protein TadD n=1 Tax=Hydrogeniiclostridium mannosilyticum TaxID=2764322 RepID=A0A328UH46_9FIRM|nr:pilus assembly protein TadD [Hydrogeniiclostridium mannosilyticum]RAQ30082.1 pilus assembly protein TadD [Hydrogeniiclostridium mannosilyticum]